MPPKPNCWEPLTMPEAVAESEKLGLRCLFQTGGEPKIEDYAPTHGAVPAIRIEQYRDGRVMAYRRKADVAAD